MSKLLAGKGQQVKSEFFVAVAWLTILSAVDFAAAPAKLTPLITREAGVYKAHNPLQLVVRELKRTQLVDDKVEITLQARVSSNVDMSQLQLRWITMSPLIEFIGDKNPRISNLSRSEPSTVEITAVGPNDKNMQITLQAYTEAKNRHMGVVAQYNSKTVDAVGRVVDRSDKVSAKKLEANNSIKIFQ